MVVLTRSIQELFLSLSERALGQADTGSRDRNCSDRMFLKAAYLILLRPLFFLGGARARELVTARLT